MSLTTEQKINLLILAGYVPAAMDFDGVVLPRIVMGNPEGIPSLWVDRDGEWEYDDYMYTARNPSAWEYMQLDTCPDELIYKAIGATT